MYLFFKFFNLVKPKEYENEDLDSTDPNSLYFIYVCRKYKELAIKMKAKEFQNQVKREKQKLKIIQFK